MVTEEKKEQEEEKPQSFWIVPTDVKSKHFLVGIIILVFLAAVSAYLFSTDLSFFVTVIWGLLILSVIPVAMLLVRFWIWERERLRAFRRVLIYWVAALVLLAPAVIAGHMIVDYNVEQAKRSCEPVIQALESYFEKHDCYPEALTDLMELEQTGITELPVRCMYHPSEDKSSYYIELVSPRIFEFWIYSSDTRKWREG